MKNTYIEWADHTFNPWEGCTKVSSGCAHCYAEARNSRFGGGTAPNWGSGKPRRRTSMVNWKQPIRWNQEAVEAMSLSGTENPTRRPRVFCASLADWLDDEVPVEWLSDLLELIRITPHLDWLLLTKRPQNWGKRISAVHRWQYDVETMESATPLGQWLAKWATGMPELIPHNVWIGTTVEDQARAAERIPHLLDTPARIRFLSCEPLLGPVDLTQIPWSDDPVVPGASRTCLTASAAMLSSKGRPAIGWVICGGESGPGARPMHPDWARSLRDQCAATGVAFFFKQWGEWAPDDGASGLPPERVCWVSTDGPSAPVGAGELSGANAQMTSKVGKSTAGRLLDGIEHNAFPEVRS